MAATDPGSLRFVILGPVQAWRDGAEVRLGPPQQRALLALLLAHAGRPVSLESLVDALWPAEPPLSAVNVVHRYVGVLRRLFEPDLPVRAAGRWLVRGAGGYRLDVDADSLDLLAFRRLVTQAGQAGAGGSPQRAVDLFAQALDLWQGRAAAGIEADVRADAVFAALDHEYLETVRAAAGVALRAGLSARLLARVRQAALEHRLDEPLHARLMLMLAASGQPAEALRTFGVLRARLDDELGVGPGAEVTAAYDRILRATPEPVPVALHRPPAQLPADLASFTGRLAELTEALGLLERGSAASSVVVSAVGGMAGIGKTTLAVHWAHRVAARFPDGQLFLNLRGFGPAESVVTPGQALRHLLDAFAVPPREIPAELDAQAALYRSLVSGRRMLIVLDNARDAEQVRPLLPGSPGCFTIVTSRNNLAELVAAEGAHVLTLAPLPAEAAREFLGRRLGTARVGAEPAAVEAIVRACAGLPLGLAIVAARAAVHPGFPLSEIARELVDAQGTLQAFSGLDRSVDPTALFSWSYRALAPAAARLFRLLGLHPGPSVGLTALSRLADLAQEQARPLAAELTRAHLLTEISPGRYALHDLIRAYAVQLVEEPDADAGRHRLLTHYLGAAAAAVHLFVPASRSARVSAPWRAADAFAGRPDAAGWLAAERSALLAAQRMAVEHGFDEAACRLAATLTDYLEMAGRWSDWADSQRTAGDAARRTGDRAAEADSFRNLGLAEHRLGHPELALTHLGRALEIFQELGDRAGEALAHRAIAHVLDDLPEALRHAERALDLSRATGGGALGNALNEVGWYSARLGRYAEAFDFCSQALAVFRGLDPDSRSTAAVLDTLGYIERHQGHHDQSARYYQQAVDLRRANGDRYPQASSLLGLATTREDAGDVAGAAGARWEALGILDDLGHPEAAAVRDRLKPPDPPP